MLTGFAKKMVSHWGKSGHVSSNASRAGKPATAIAIEPVRTLWTRGQPDLDLTSESRERASWVLRVWRHYHNVGTSSASPDPKVRTWSRKRKRLNSASVREQTRKIPPKLPPVAQWWRVNGPSGPIA